MAAGPAQRARVRGRFRVDSPPGSATRIAGGSKHPHRDHRPPRRVRQLGHSTAMSRSFSPVEPSHVSTTGCRSRADRRPRPEPSAVETTICPRRRRRPARCRPRRSCPRGGAGEPVADLPLDDPLERAGAEGRVVAVVGERLSGRVGDLERRCAGRPAGRARRLELDVDDAARGRPRSSDRKRTMSSMRLMNSGLKKSRGSPGRFDVMISTALVKSTVRPWPSVRRPSSSSCSSTLNTSGWAFSISSSSTTA